MLARVFKRDFPVLYETERLHDELDAAFKNFFQDVGRPMMKGDLSAKPFVPKLDIREAEKEYLVSIELPGMKENDIDLSLTRESLIIKGTKKAEKEEKKENYYFSERSYGSFCREVPLPGAIEEKSVSAKFHDGILEVTLPKSEEETEQIKRIPITTH